MPAMVLVFAAIVISSARADDDKPMPAMTAIAQDARGIVFIVFIVFILFRSFCLVGAVLNNRPMVFHSFGTSEFPRQSRREMAIQLTWTNARF
jgi:hypothetical protein